MTRAEGLVAVGPAAVAVRPPDDDIDELASTCLAKPSILELRRDACVGFNGEAPLLTVKLLADGWCDRIPGWLGVAKWAGCVCCGNTIFGNAALPGSAVAAIRLLADDTDELPALAFLTKPSKLELRREGCIGFIGEGELLLVTVKLPADV
jgi:hypothetical protein